MERPIINMSMWKSRTKKSIYNSLDYSYNILCERYEVSDADKIEAIEFINDIKQEIKLT